MIPAFFSFIKKLFDKKVIRFLFVGGLNTIVGLGSFYLCIFFGIQYLIANIISTIIGTAHSYVWNKFFTFQSKKKSSAELIRFCIVYAASFCIGTGTLYLMVDIFKLNTYLAGFLNLIVTTSISWFGHNYFSFRKVD